MLFEYSEADQAILDRIDAATREFQESISRYAKAESKGDEIVAHRIYAELMNPWIEQYTKVMQYMMPIRIVFAKPAPPEGM